MTTRRRFLIGAAALGAQRLYGDSDGLDGASLYRDVVTYASLGEHRTGTEVDIKTSNWLASELRRAGCDVSLMAFQTQQFFPTAIDLQIDGKRVNSFPLWWPRPTGPVPTIKPLVAVDPKSPGTLAGKIALVKIQGNNIRPTIEALQKAGAVGIVAMTLSPTGQLVEFNAESGLGKCAVPILIAGQDDEPILDDAAMRGAECSLLLDGSYKQDATAFEVMGRLRRGKKLVVVSTPSSGWFHCAGERGPGIALWLGLARWAARQKSDLSYLFVASSGHELGYAGMAEFLRRQAPPVRDVICWLHLGAGIATYAYMQTDRGFEKQASASGQRRLYCSQDFAPILRRAFADLPDLKPIMTDKPGGEMIDIADKGYPYFGFAGGSAMHHMPADLPERITGPELLEPVGRDLIKAFVALSPALHGG